MYLGGSLGPVPLLEGRHGPKLTESSYLFGALLDTCLRFLGTHFFSEPPFCGLWRTFGCQWEAKGMQTGTKSGGKSDPGAKVKNL